MAEADAIDAALLLDDLLRLAGPALGEGELGLFGLVVGDALGAPAAPLAGVDDEKGVGLVQPVLPGQIAGQHHDAVAGVLYACWTFSSARLTALALSIWFSRICFATATALKKQASWSSFESHTGLKKPIVAKAVLLAGVVVQIEGLDEVLINEPGLTLAYKAGAEYPPQQPKAA